MNICFCNTNQSWGGGEKWHTEMAMALADLPDMNVSFLISKYSEINKRLNTRKVEKLFFEVGKFSFLSALKSNQLYRLLNKYDFDVLIFNGPNELKLVARIAKKCGIKKIIYRRGSDKIIKNSFLNRYLLENVVTDIIANSEATKRSLLYTGINIAHKIQIINNGVTAPQHKIQRSRSEDLIVGAIGRLEREKGFDLLIKSAKILKDQGLKFKVRIAGEGRQKSELNKLIAINDLQDFVELVGFRQDIYQFLSECNVFALSSRYEGFGYVTVEAMFTELPVVAFNISATRELVVDNQTGFLIEPYDINEFAEALKKLLLNPAMTFEFGKAGYSRAVQKFSFDSSVNKIIELMKS